jgi:hypothetical protein
MLIHEPKALSHGLLVWQGEGDAFDSRLHFATWPSNEPIPDKAPGLATWGPTLWGTTGGKLPRKELKALRVFDSNRWALERLHLTIRDGPGANLDKLGIKKK